MAIAFQKTCKISEAKELLHIIMEISQRAEATKHHFYMWIRHLFEQLIFDELALIPVLLNAYVTVYPVFETFDLVDNILSNVSILCEGLSELDDERELRFGRKLTLISVSFKSVPVFISWILEYFKSIFSSIRLALKRMILRQFLKSRFVVLNIVQDVKIFDTLSKTSSANLLMLQTSFDIKQTIDILDFTAAFYKLAQDVCKLVYSFYYRQNVINFNRLSLIC